MPGMVCKCKGLQKLGIGIEEALMEVSLGWESFGLYNKDGKFYTFQNKYVRNYMRKTIGGGRVVTYNRFFESDLFDKIIMTLRNHLNKYYNEISTVMDKYLE